MKTVFPGHFANGAEDMERLWAECIFVLDANVLLSLYRFSDVTRSELTEIFKSLKERLWIPHQVAHEYLENRLSVIGDQIKAYDDALKQVNSLKVNLENINHQPFVSAGVLAEANDVFVKLTAEFTEGRKQLAEKIYSDDIKSYLEKMLGGKVGEPYSRDELESLIVLGKDRYDEKIPPGFGDKKKGGDSTLFIDRCKPYGDFIVWRQIIAEAKRADKSIIFITGDEKEDWWLFFQGKTIGPLPALIQEFKLETGRDFYMYTPHRFVEHSIGYLDKSVSQVVVDEIRGAAEDAKQRAVADNLTQEGSKEQHVVDEFSTLHENPVLRRIFLLGKGRDINIELQQLIDRKSECEEKLRVAMMKNDSFEFHSLVSDISRLTNKIYSMQRELDGVRLMMKDCNQEIHGVMKSSD